MTTLHVHRSRRPRELTLRLGVALAVTLAGAVVVAAACTGSSEPAQQSDNSGPFCPAAPCEAGAICMLPQDSNCNGEWYCWGDHNWYCAPPDSGPPPDVGPVNDDGAAHAGDDSPDDVAIDVVGFSDAADSS
jgi:hypothetical protein